MKITAFVLKIAACILAAAAIVCVVLAHMDRISDWMACFWAQVQEKKRSLCGGGKFCKAGDDFEEWDA